MTEASFIEGVCPKGLDALFGIFQKLEAGACIALEANEDLHPSLAVPSGPGSWLGVTSSGSSGRPKLAWRHWSELRHQAAQRQDLRGWKWASPYQPWSFAGVQVALQAWVSGGEVRSLPSDWQQAWDILVHQNIDALSATPTFMDLLLQAEAPWSGDWSPKQVTLGGEPLRPQLGARLARRWPHAHFTVIYAAAEFGVIAKTQRLDGWYELEVMEKRWPNWRERDGMLELQKDGDWRVTGDQIEVADGRMRVIGRADSVANIGGTKVSLSEIAELAEQVSGIRRAMAVSEQNPITGQVVCLKYALEPGADPNAVTDELQRYLRAHLRKEAWPRRWVIDEIGPVNNAKRAVR